MSSPTSPLVSYPSALNTAAEPSSTSSPLPTPEDGETAESCITYTHLSTGQVIAQEDAPVINDPSKIVLQLPARPAGVYTLTLKTLFSNAATTLKAPRYITSKVKLEVK